MMVTLVTSSTLILLGCVIYITASRHPRDIFRATATAVLTANNIHRREIQPTVSTKVSLRHGRKVKENFIKRSRYTEDAIKRSLPLNNPHPLLGKLKSKQNIEHAPDTSDDDNLDTDNTSDSDSINFDDDEDDEDESSPTAATLSDVADPTDNSISSETSQSKNESESNNVSTSNVQKNDDTEQEDKQDNYIFNSDDDSDDTEDALPTDTPDRKTNIITANGGKTEIRKKFNSGDDDEINRLLRLEADIDEMTKRLPMKRSKMMTRHSRN